MRSSQGSGKAIKVTPEELIFDQVQLNQSYQQEVTLKNNLSAPVDIVLKSSNQDRIDIEPKKQKLAPFETLTAEVTVKLTRALPFNTPRVKENIFIKSDFFDQKINITLIPAMRESQTTPRDNSLQNSTRLASLGTRRDTSREAVSVRQRDYSPFNYPNPPMSDNDRQIEEKNAQVTNLKVELQRKDIEIQSTYAQLKEEIAKRKEVESKLNQDSSQESNPQNYLEQVRGLLREREPNLEKLMELTLKKEKEQIERKDAKVLEILKIKDKQIEELQQRVVLQEAEYGKLAQSFQDGKRKLKAIEEENNQLKLQIMKLMQDSDDLQAQISQFQKGTDYQQMQGLQDQLMEAQQIIENLKQQNWSQESQMNEKLQTDAYIQEAIERFKKQLEEKDSQITELSEEIEKEKVQRIREKERSKSLQEQINSISQESMNERTQMINKLQFEKEYVDKVGKLQDEKNELIDAINDFKKDYSREQDQLKYILERLSHIRGSSMNISSSMGSQNPSLSDQLERKVEEVARIMKEFEEDNIDMNNRIRSQQDQLKSREQELQMIVEENEILQIKSNIKKRGASCQTPIDNQEMDNIVNSYEDIKQKVYSLEDENDKLEKENSNLAYQLQSVKREFDNTQQELNFLVKSQQRSSTVMSERPAEKLNSTQDDNEELVSKLNAKITQLKLNEEKLMHQVQMMKSVELKTDSFAYTNSKGGDNRQILALEEKLGEYEQIVLDQRERLMTLENQKLELDTQLREYSQSKQNEIELYKKRIYQLNEMNAKIQQFVKRENHQASQLSESSNEIVQLSTQKSTAVDQERARQIIQTLEMSNMNIKHQLQEIALEKEQIGVQLEQLKSDCFHKDQELIKLRQDIQVHKVGIDLNYMGDSNSGQDSRLMKKVQEQKQRIRELEEQISKRSYQMGMSISDESNNYQVKKLEEVLKTNERLRKEHQQSTLMVEDVKEEFSTKLNQISDKYEDQRQKLMQENVTLSRKCEHLSSQIQYMEKKEIRLFGQLEEANLLQSQEVEEKERRTKELEELLYKKEEIINELEREIKIKDKTLQERQDQVSILMGTMDKEHTHDENRQKILNLSAELCSIKAIEAQLERKSNELSYQLKKSELSNEKLKKQFESEKQKQKEQATQIQNIEKENKLLHQKVHDVEMKKDEKERDLNDAVFKSEREQFHIQMKDETISQLREQIKRSEVIFKEEVERIRKDFLEKSLKQMPKFEQESSSKVTSLKTAVQQLHLLIGEFIQRQAQGQERLIITEYEKVLSEATIAIEKLQQELDKEKILNCLFENDIKSGCLNKILIARQESLAKRLQSLQLSYQQREDERMKFTKYQESSLQKIIRDQEIQLDHLNKVNSEIEDQNITLKKEKLHLQNQKEDLEQSLVCYQQDFENQKLAIERKAELTVDERYKAKHDAIKTYFETNISKILLNQGNKDFQAIEFGREISSLKLLITKLESQIISEQAEKESQELNLQHYRVELQQNEQRYRELQVKMNQQSQKSQQNELMNKMEVQKYKSDIMNLERQVLQAKQMVEEKSKELLLQQNYTQKEDVEINPFKLNSTEFENRINDERLRESSQKVQELQEKLMELRGQHIQEIEELKNQFDIELQEAQLKLQREKEQLESQYKPGFAPGEIMLQNETLQVKIRDLKSALERSTQENILLRKRLETENKNLEQAKNEAEAHKVAVQDLEQTIVESQNQQFSVQQQKEVNLKDQSFKKNLKSSIKQRSRAQNEENKQQFLDETSLNVSALTSMRGNLRQSFGGGEILPQSQKNFILNPPQLVRSFIQSKINEMLVKKKIDQQLQIEIQLRKQAKQLSEKLREAEQQLQLNKQTMSEYEREEQESDLKRKLIQLEVENEDLKIQKAQEMVQNITYSYNPNTQTNQQIEYPYQDYNLLVESLVSVCSQLAQFEVQAHKDESENYSKNIEEAQRVVIKGLLLKLMTEKQSIDIQYAPSEEFDRKIWYLELLEQQLDTSDTTITTLQNFIKKLQIEISGNLQSAAQIKATSMELAQNTKKTSDEVKLLRQVAGLIRHDLGGMMPNQQDKQQNKTMNPFSQTGKQISQHLHPQNQIYDSLMSNNESLSNQLNLTEKVKKTMENEMVQMKIHHKQELQQLKNQLQQTADQRNSLLSTNEELHEKISNLEQHLDNLKSEISQTNKENNATTQALKNNEKEKEALVKNKNATSKHLQKLQQDLHEWRKTSEENMRIKERQVEDLQKNLSQAQTEKDRLKSENQMLRRNEKDRKHKDSEDVSKLEEQNKELVQKLNKEIEERKKEIEYWVTERATMREMIDQLECEKVGLVVKDDSEQDDSAKQKIKQIKKKSSNKLKQKEAEIKTLEKNKLQLQDEVASLKLRTTQQESKMREQIFNSSELQNQMKFMQQKLKEVELERDLILTEKQNALSTNDMTAQQISSELNSLRECFAKLKVERDNLLNEIKQSQERENEWRKTVEKMNSEIKQMDYQISIKDKDQSNDLRMLEQKNQTLIQDVKFLKNQNESLKERLRESEQHVMNQEKRIHDEEMKQSQIKFQNDEAIKVTNDIKLQLNQRDQVINEMKNQIMINESDKNQEIGKVRDKIDEVKEANAQIIALYENQLEVIRAKILKEQKKGEQQVDQMFSLAQREAVIKQLKKENTQFKLQVQKMKLKNKEMKKVVQNNENQSQSANTTVSINKNQKSKHRQSIAPEEQIDKKVIKLAQVLNQNDGYGQIMEQIESANKNYLKLAEVEAQLAKSENWNMVLSQQLQELQQQNELLSRNLDSLQKSQIKESKIQKSTIQQSEISKQQKQELKQLQNEIKIIKAEWIPQSEYKQIQEQMKDHQNQVKSLKEEINRKRDVINQLKQQREQTEVEANQILTDMEGLKDDNIKLQRLIKENNKNQQQVKELKSSNDFLKTQEKKLKEEIGQLNDKVKSIKLECSRKEQIIKEYREKIDQIQEDVVVSKDKMGEVERFRDLAKKNRLEAEIKDNQVKALKQRLETYEQEIEDLKQSQQAQQQPNQQEKVNKVKLRKYEGYLKKSLESLRRIGKELTQVTRKQSSVRMKSDIPLQISDLDKEMYKDSVNILGVSMDELEEFMNPNAGGNSLMSDIAKENQTFMAKLDSVLQIPDSLNADLDQICNHCMKLISESN